MAVAPSKFDELIREMEKPFNEAIGFIDALRLMGEGLDERGYEGCAVLAVSEAVHERLQKRAGRLVGIGSGGGRSRGTTKCQVCGSK